MKKALVVLLALAVGAVAFADGATAAWTANTWYGFGVYSPSAGNELVPYDYSWVGAGAARVGFKYTAADGNVGFYTRTEITSLTKPVAVQWNRLVGWGKFFDGMLTIRAGILDDYTIATTDWFTYGTTNGKTGMYFNLAPMAGLNIGFYQVIPPASVGISANGDIIGLAFAMPDLVSVQAGVTLDFSNTATNGHAVYFGANLSAVKDLTAILEGQVKLLNGSTPIQLEQNLGYAMGALTVGARVGESMNGSTFNWGVEPTVSYKVNDNITVNAIVNVYSDPGQTFMSPIDAGVVAGGATATTNFGGGVSLNYIMGGATLTVGDYYGAATGAGNLFYVNFDVAL